MIRLSFLIALLVLISSAANAQELRDKSIELQRHSSELLGASIKAFSFLRINPEAYFDVRYRDFDYLEELQAAGYIELVRHEEKPSGFLAYNGGAGPFVTLNLTNDGELVQAVALNIASDTTANISTQTTQLKAHSLRLLGLDLNELFYLIRTHPGVYHSEDKSKENGDFPIFEKLKSLGYIELLYHRGYPDGNGEDPTFQVSATKGGMEIQSILGGPGP